MADRAQLLALVHAEDDRAERALGLPGPPADHDAVGGAHALDLHHADALAGPVGLAGLLGDHALLGLQPALGVARAAHDRGNLHALHLLKRLAAVVVAVLHQHL